MWFVILLGLTIEALAIVFAVSEEGLLFYSWLASLIAAAIVRFAFYGGGYSYSFWSILILFLIVSHAALALKLIGKRQKELNIKRKQEREREDRLRREAKEKEEDEKRILALIPVIKNGKKYPAFDAFLSQNLLSISSVIVRQGTIIVQIPKSGRLFAPNYQAGRMEIDNSRGFYEQKFFGTSSDERSWTVFEQEALARIADQRLRECRIFQIVQSSDGYRIFERIAPTDQVIAKTPY